jgi:hypothetical protein
MQQRGEVSGKCRNLSQKSTLYGGPASFNNDERFVKGRMVVGIEWMQSCGRYLGGTENQFFDGKEF